MATELIGFLSHPTPHIQKAAVNIVRDYTGSEDGLQSLGKYFSVVVPSTSLCRLLAEKKEVSEPAAEALVNLSQVPDLAKKMVEMDIIKIVMDILYKLDCHIKHLLVIIIVNLTLLDVGIESLLQNGDKMQGLYIMKLVRSFCASSSEEKGDDPFEHVASILVNVSQKEAGRKLLLDPKLGLLKQIIRQFDSPSPLRKKGVSLEQSGIVALKLKTNFKICFSYPSFCGPLYYFQLLEKGYTEAGRRAFWSVNGPRILQVGYEDEENPQVMEAYERVGSLLIHEDGADAASTRAS